MLNKKIYYFLVIILLISLLSFIVGSEKEQIDEVINGQLTDVSEIQTLLGDESLLLELNKRFSEDIGILNSNDLLRKEWLSHYKIENEDIKFESFDGNFLKTSGSESTVFELGKVPVKSINSEGAIELGGGERVIGGEVSLVGDVIQVESGVLDISSYDKNKEIEFELVGKSSLLNGDNEYALKENLRKDLLDKIKDVSFMGVGKGGSGGVSLGGDDDYFKELANGDGNIESPAEEVKSIKVSLGRDGSLIEGNEIVEANNDEILTITSGQVLLKEDGRKSIKGSLIQYLEDEPSFMFENDNFVDYIFGDGDCSDAISCIQNIDGNLRIKSVGDEISVFDFGKIKNFEIDKIEGGGGVVYFSDEDIPSRAWFTEDGFEKMWGFFDKLDKIKFVDPDTGELIKTGEIFARITTGEAIEMSNEYREAQKIYGKIEKMNDPIAIILAEGDYKNDKSDIPFVYEAAENMKIFYKRAGISEENIFYLKDLTKEEALKQISEINNKHKDSGVAFYYIGHGMEGEKGFVTDINEKEIYAEDFDNAFGGKSPVYIIEACHSEQICREFGNAQYVLASSKKDQSTWGFIEDRSSNIIRGSILSNVMSQTMDLKNSRVNIPNIDKVLLNGFKDEWLTRILSGGQGGHYGIKRSDPQTPVVIKFVLSLVI